MFCPDNIHYWNCLRQEIFEEILALRFRNNPEPDLFPQ